jgi:hypothetical protein
MYENVTSMVVVMKMVIFIIIIIIIIIMGFLANFFSDEQGAGLLHQPPT